MILASAWFWECRAPEGPRRFSDSVRQRAAVPGAPRPDGVSHDAGAPRPAGPSHAGRAAPGSAGGFRGVLAAFRDAGAFSEGLAPVQVGTRWGYADTLGRIAVPPAFDWAGPFHEGRAAVVDSGAYRFIDSAGGAVGSLAFTDARPFSGGRAAVRFGDAEDGAWGFIDRNGGLAIPPAFADVPGGFSGGYAVVTVAHEGGRSFGFIDTAGGFAMDSLFDAAGDFSQGLAPVGRGTLAGGRLRGTWSYVDAAGARAFPGEWLWAGSFRGDRALVMGFDGGFSLIDRGGSPAGPVPDTLRPVAAWRGGIVSYTLRPSAPAAGKAGSVASAR